LAGIITLKGDREQKMSSGEETTELGYKPLYAQVKDRLIRRLIDGIWKPGQMIASEMELAREIGVSQGTIRKALDAMTAENLLVRRQGRGTYVAEPEESSILFRYFRLVGDDGERTFPTSTVLRWQRDHANADESEALAIARKASVWRFERVRTIGNKPLLVETITLPVARFPGFDKIDPVPNNVYRLYSERWSLTIARAIEKLKAISASAGDAEILGCKAGTPLLQIFRIAHDLEDKPVELRISRCLTDYIHYLSDLR
jgi:GntR family transcriptional regulator